MKKVLYFVAGIATTILAQVSYEKNDTVKNTVDAAKDKAVEIKDNIKGKIRDLVS